MFGPRRRLWGLSVAAMLLQRVVPGCMTLLLGFALLQRRNSQKISVEFSGG
jgi:hypothetical protein